jgi:acyl-CoA dehydrogenase
MKHEHGRTSVTEWLMDKSREIRPVQVESLVSFAMLVDKEAEPFALPVDRAAVGGFLADRVAYAFAAGYGAALRRLVPELPAATIMSLCVTERGGGHPRAIRTRLDEAGPGRKGFVLTGEKTFITAALEARMLLVAASTGTGHDGKNRIRMVLVGRDEPGVEVTAMTDLPFVPEISHGVVSLAGVAVDECDILPGDGYDDYIKPFRTIEDLHVLAAVIGYLFRVAALSRWPQEIREELLALTAAARQLASEDPLSPALHVALAGFMTLFDGFLDAIEPLWDRTDAATRAGWMRDRVLLSVAQKARDARRSAAWRRYGS